MAEDYERRKVELRQIVAARRVEFDAWAKANPEKAADFRRCVENRLPAIDWDAIEVKPGSASRAASAAVLEYLGRHICNMVVSSADLANSDKTDGFLKATGALRRHDFKGGFLHAGVAELTMACIMNGVALHGGMIAACGTFFVFSDYMKPAIRMSALQELPVKYIFSHDSFRVGEDGPTHEPIEHEAQIRLLEQMRNLSGERAALVLRPADAAETVEAYRVAMNEWKRPSVLILSRQDLEDIPSDDRRRQAAGVARGGYVVYGSDSERPDILLVGNGSDVALLYHAAEALSAEGVKARVVSVPSIGLYLDQPEEYRESVMPSGVRMFGLTSGLTSTLYPLMRGDFEVCGLERFGASAPAKVLEEKFGYTVENILGQIKLFLTKKR